MTTRPRPIRLAPLLAAVAATTTATSMSRAAVATWTGGASGSALTAPANWLANAAPSPDDTLVFDGFSRLTPLNTFGADTPFDGLSFAPTAGPFVLIGSRVLLHDDVTDDSASFPQTLSLPILLDSTRNLTAAAPGARLTLAGVISSATGTFGITKTGPGSVTLASPSNTFTGPVTVTQGTLTFSADPQLGASPASPSPGSIILNGGSLRATSSLTLNPNRGIALGPLFTAGPGTLDTPVGVTLSYAGSLADNDFGGTGSLVKTGAGTLALSGPNTYTGPTLLRTGTLLLDFSQPTSPTDNLLASPSLTLGGIPAPGGNSPGTTTLSLLGKPGVSNTQSFSSTSIDAGNNSITTTNTVTLSLGAISHRPGGVLSLPPTATLLADSPRDAILGGFATIGTDWAYVNSTGQITPLPAANYTTLTGATPLPDAPGANVKLAGLTADISTIPNPSGYTNVSTLSYADTTPRTLTIPPGKTLRLSVNGGIFHTAATTTPLTLTGGTLTAGDAPDSPGEVVLHANSSGQTTPVLIIASTLADNGSAAPLTLVKTGIGAAQITNPSNTYSGGTYINQGRLQLGPSPGTGPVVVQPGGQAFLASSTTYTHSFIISGTGTAAEPYGAIRTDNATTLAGAITLAGDARIQSVATAAGSTKTSTITGPITGHFSLETGGAQGNPTSTSILVLTNPANNYTGDTKISVGTGNYTLRLGASDVLPHGPGKGNLSLNGGAASPKATLDLNAHNQTLNGLSSTGNPANNLITNTGTSPSTLTVGYADQSSTFTGTLQDTLAGPITLIKTGRGALTLNGPLSLTGVVVSAGQLTLAPGADASRIGILTASTSATVDLTTASLVLTATSPTTLRSFLLAHTLSSSSADPSHSLGYLDTGTALTVQLTLTGDANVDGAITPDDYALLDRGLATGGSYWWQGDFNYDGAVDQNDYLLIDTILFHQAQGFGPGFLSQRDSQFGEAYVSTLLASIPEPAPALSSILYLLSSLSLTRRRRT